MKTLAALFSLLLFVLVVSGCDGTAERSVVLDGPMMEMVDETGELEYHGALTNISSKSVSSVVVVITLKNEDGEVIEIKSVSATEELESEVLMPEESVFFTVGFESNPDVVVTKEVEIYYYE